MLVIRKKDHFFFVIFLILYVHNNGKIKMILEKNNKMKIDLFFEMNVSDWQLRKK